MAATRWTDPDNWTFADCSDNTKQPLISHLLPTWKAASDEWNAFLNVTHESGFVTADTFPDLIGDLMNFGANAPKNTVIIKNSVYPEDVVDTDSVNTSGLFSNAASDFYDTLTLSELLTGPLGYDSGTLLHDTETDGGDQNALFRMPWFVQWFEVIDYAKYYTRVLNSALDHIEDLEVQSVSISVKYEFNVGTASFVGATAFLDKNQGTPVDIYVANDLNESAPFSTHAEVRDYAADLLVANDSTWVASLPVSYPGSQAGMLLRESLFAGVTKYTANMNIIRMRFKIKDMYRATSPDRYTTTILWNGFYKQPGALSGSFADNLGTGETNLTMLLVELTKVGGWYYLDVATTPGGLPDFKSLAPPGSVGDTSQTITREDLNTNATENVLFSPNQSDGTERLFYTP